MSAREATTMGDILAAEANILGMIKEVNSILKCILLKKLLKKITIYNCAFSAKVNHVACLVCVF